MIYDPNKPLLRLLLVTLALIGLVVYGMSVSHIDIAMDFLARNQAPSEQYWFGTDNLGRSLWLRCFQGMLSSLNIGLTSAVVSGAIALIFAGISSINTYCDFLVRGVVDALLALPHLLLLILICFTLGGGQQGVIWAVALTHWPKLALILRGEIQRVREADYVMLSRRIGNTPFECVKKHYLPMLLPQWIVGTLLMFPHAVLHSAALSFLGFGQAAHEPSLGLLLADALRYLSTGSWWMVVFPGLILMCLVLIFDQFAKAMQQLWLRGAGC